jgi:hypothetical protein
VTAKSMVGLFIGLFVKNRLLKTAGLKDIYLTKTKDWFRWQFRE